MPITLYLWRTKDPQSGRCRELRWRMSEAEARAWARSQGGAEIERVEGSEEVRGGESKPRGVSFPRP